MSNNGYITFKYPFKSSTPVQFPLAGRLKDIPVVAPFWAHTDTDNIPVNASQVFYHIYDLEEPVSEESQFVMDLATRDAEAYQGDAEFQASLVIVITWERMVPFPGSPDTNEVQNTYMYIYIYIYICTEISLLSILVYSVNTVAGPGLVALLW